MLDSLLDKDDRDYERQQRLEEQRKAAGLPDETLRKHSWTPPDPTKDVWGKPLKKKRKA